MNESRRTGSSHYFILKVCSTSSEQFSHILACESISLHKHCCECAGNPYAPSAGPGGESVWVGGREGPLDPLTLKPCTLG